MHHIHDIFDYFFYKVKRTWNAHRTSLYILRIAWMIWVAHKILHIRWRLWQRYKLFAFGLFFISFNFAIKTDSLALRPFVFRDEIVFSYNFRVFLPKFVLKMSKTRSQILQIANFVIDLIGYGPPSLFKWINI